MYYELTNEERRVTWIYPNNPQLSILLVSLELIELHQFSTQKQQKKLTSVTILCCLTMLMSLNSGEITVTSNIAPQPPVNNETMLDLLIQANLLIRTLSSDDLLNLPDTSTTCILLPSAKRFLRISARFISVAVLETFFPDEGSNACTLKIKLQVV